MYRFFWGSVYVYLDGLIIYIPSCDTRRDVVGAL